MDMGAKKTTKCYNTQKIITVKAECWACFCCAAVAMVVAVTGEANFVDVLLLSCRWLAM